MAVALRTRRPRVSPPKERPSAPPPGEQVGTQGWHKWIILIGLVTSAVLEVMDTTIVNVALPRMSGNFGATPYEIAWVSTGYILDLLHKCCILWSCFMLT